MNFRLSSQVHLCRDPVVSSVRPDPEIFGECTFPDHARSLDRFAHICAIGKAATGKSMFLADPALARMLTTPKQDVRIRHVMDEVKVLIAE